MKIISNLFLLCFMVSITLAAEQLPLKDDPDPVSGVTQSETEPNKENDKEPAQPLVAAASSSQTAQISEQDDDWCMVPEQKDDISQAHFEKLTKILQRLKEASADNMPMEIFEIEPNFWKSLKVSGGFWMKSTAISLANLYTYIAPFSLSYILRSVSSPALYSYATLVTKGDSENFPPLPLNFIVQILQKGEVQDRQKFAQIPVQERSLPFETEGFNGFGKGYKGRLVIVDFVYGTRLVEGGGEYRVISQYADKNPLDFLVSLKEFKSPLDWINARFVIPSPVELAKIGQTFKNKGGHTCILYEAAAPPGCLMILALRIPEQEYLQTIDLWKEVWLRNQQAVTPTKNSTAEISGQ